MSQAAYRIDDRLVDRAAFYAVACDPARSVAVEACAGAGKTWMLVSRILRALLDGTAPQDILAITFTKKAAGEMRLRLQDWLREFATLDEARLTQELVWRGMAPAEASRRVGDLKGLHAQLLATGRPVQIRTFHSWFAALLRGAPLSVLDELDLPPDHELLEDDTEAVALVWPRFYAAVVADPSLHRDFMDSVARYGRHQTLKGLGNALGKRVEFALADEKGVVDDSVQPFSAVVPALAGLEQPEQALAGGLVRARWLARARELGAEKNKTPQKAADAVVEAFAQPEEDAEALARRLAQLRKAFFVADEDRLTAHLAKFPAAQTAEAELQPLLLAVRQHEAWQYQQRMARLSRALLVAYRELKRERGWVDMNDVEGAARRLLGDAELSGWMQQRLDARVRHLLIDEFQDTNPLQWQALYGWLSGYAGAGPGEAPKVFLVGDPKQSIYRFRRAEPQVFKAAQAFVVDGLAGALLSCDHTRRCATGVIDTLNAVMEGASRDAGYAGFRPHTTESREAGAVLTLPTVSRDRVKAADESGVGEDPGWRDSLAAPRVTPEESLSALEAAQAADWIAAQITGGQLRPEEVMVLSRKRERLGWMHEALAERGIAAEQPEKLDLADAPAVQDVVALLDALVSPAHDLSLARALRSPVFGLGDAALVRVARLARRMDAAFEAAREEKPVRTSWWEVLQAVDPAGSDDPETDTLLVSAANRLVRWRQWVDSLPPHDALAAIYREGDLLARYAAAVPERMREPVLASLRALLAQSLAQDGGRYLTVYRFVRALKAGGIRWHGVVHPQAVRLLTIHGAKGLEAHTVLMLDTDAGPPRAESMGVLVDWPGEAERPRRFVFLASEKQPPACAEALLVAELQARSLEELNALYVGLTRAEQRIVVSSVEPHGRGIMPSWRHRIEPLAQALESPLPIPPATESASSLTCTLTELPTCSVPRSPSPEAASAIGDDTAARIGLALHRLLQWVPTPLSGFRWDEQHRLAVAREFELTPAQAQQAQDSALAVIQGQAAWAWEADQLTHWGNEVDLWAEGQLQRLDRLVRRADTGCWWVLDYKSALRPERQAALREQLQRYHRALSLAHPGDPVRLAFINARGELIEIPADN